ncbi:hypothetical protein CMV63_16870 [Escherichia coli]|nr:hypothetical protein TH56_17000 [Escherichia coli]RJK14523.1 hypothetical protein CMV63_16870 [Escherichia coli]RJK25087.1 hypothetical protein CMV45_17600 [Escherichia coli]
MGVCFVPKANVANSALFSDGAVATGTATVQSAKANTLHCGDKLIEALAQNHLFFCVNKM